MQRTLNGTEVESKEKHGICAPMQELTITSPYVHSRVDTNTFTMGNPMPESTLSPSQGLCIWPFEVESKYEIEHSFSKDVRNMVMNLRKYRKWPYKVK
jgi:hypothetical protein